MIVPREKFLSIRFEVHASGMGASSSFLAHSHSSYINTNYEVHVFPVLRAPELDTVLQVESHQSGVEGENLFPKPAGHASFDAAQDAVGLLGCKSTLLAHVQLFIHQYPQTLLFRSVLNPFIPQPVLILGVALTQVQDPALGLEPHEALTGLLLKLVQVPLDGIPSLQHVNCTTQLGVICKLTEGALNPTVYVFDEDFKQYWSQYGPLRDTTCHRSPSGHQAINHYSLDVTIQPIPHPMNSSPIKFISLQFRKKDVEDHVKGLIEVQVDVVHSSSFFH
ncbi:hypothetical protein llap_2788 [Limosa lapponica baueri]|uniref:Uncharacterized protein n=1 Tax=Limosa lapponica baueri TaxID=1758121 RepID=A0A2I0ULH2_LIMLA|nr:hypothetical protein llap_2788 [Limosa lapponica baueri]